MPTLWVNINFQNDMEEKSLTLAQEEQIRKKALELKSEKKLRKVYPMVVFGDV